MLRRALTLTLLAVLAVQFLGAIALTSICVEPCPDDTEETSCPPVCALCTSCTHSQTAIVQHGAKSAPLMALLPFATQQTVASSSALADDIFHVPLLG